MSQWGNTDDAANSVLWATTQVNLTANSTNQTNLYGNTTVGAWLNNNVPMKEAIGQYGVDVVETSNSASEFDAVTHAGWVLKTTGTGPVTGVTVVSGGAGYSNTDTLSITVSGVSTVNSTGTLTTNSTGGITAITITNGGAGYVATTLSNSSFVIANSTGGSTAGAAANLVAAVGGRAGRASYETLVAMGTIA